MNSVRFLKKLRREVPDWIERGWLSEENGQALLSHVAAQAGTSHLLAYAVAILGVVLLGSGIITYFAANWQEMSKGVKLIVLLGSLYLAYGGAGYLITTKHAPRIGQATLLLGVILFGANIMLIAQIYHIDAHYPDGVMLWTLGGVLTGYLLQSQAGLIAAILLGTLWSGMETFGFDHLHWAFLLLWVAFLPAIYRWRWVPALHMAMIALLVWSLFSFHGLDLSYHKGEHIYLVQLYFTVYLSLFVTGMLLQTSERFQPFAGVVQGYSVIATLTSIYTLTFPRLQSGLRWSWDESFRQAATNLWVVWTIVCLVVLSLLSAWHWQRSRYEQRPRFLIYGRWLIGATVALILFNLFVTGVHGSWIAFAFNLLFFGGVIWLIFAGMYYNNRFLINIAFCFFALTLLSRYFDTFWTLLNRSYFFMGGGVILIAGGYLLESQRRRITAGMKESGA